MLLKSLLIKAGSSDEVVKILGFTTREVTLIGFLLLAVFCLGIVVIRLYKDKNKDIENRLSELSKERDTLISVINNNNEAMGKINTTLEIIKEKLP